MIDKWRQYAIENDYKIICIMKDLEDHEVYPVYFKTELELKIHLDNIISETKVKVIEIIK